MRGCIHGMIISCQMYQTRPDVTLGSYQECILGRYSWPRMWSLSVKNVVILGQECVRSRPRMGPFSAKNGAVLGQECCHSRPRMCQFSAKNTPILGQECCDYRPRMCPFSAKNAAILGQEYTGRFSKRFFPLSIKIPDCKKKLSEKDFFYQPGPIVNKNLSGILGNQLLPGFSENYHESSRSFWTQFWGSKVSLRPFYCILSSKVDFSGALRAPERLFRPPGNQLLSPRPQK